MLGRIQRLEGRVFAIKKFSIWLVKVRPVGNKLFVLLLNAKGMLQAFTARAVWRENVTQGRHTEKCGY